MTYIYQTLPWQASYHGLEEAVWGNQRLGRRTWNPEVPGLSSASTTLVNSQLVCLLPVGIFNTLCSIWLLIFVSRYFWVEFLKLALDSKVHFHYKKSIFLVNLRRLALRFPWTSNEKLVLLVYVLVDQPLFEIECFLNFGTSWMTVFLCFLIIWRQTSHLLYIILSFTVGVLQGSNKSPQWNGQTFFSGKATMIMFWNLLSFLKLINN